MRWAIRASHRQAKALWERTIFLGLIFLKNFFERLIVYQVTVDYVKNHLEELCDRASKDTEGVAIG
jgi:hypothetical protein